VAVLAVQATAELHLEAAQVAAADTKHQR